MDGWQQDWRGISAECVLAGAQGQGMHSWGEWLLPGSMMMQEVAQAWQSSK